MRTVKRCKQRFGLGRRLLSALSAPATGRTLVQAEAQIAFALPKGDEARHVGGRDGTRVAIRASGRNAGNCSIAADAWNWHRSTAAFAFHFYATRSPPRHARGWS